MAILGITNRTENWKTARYFVPLDDQGLVGLARQLLPEGEERAGLEEGAVSLELFWRGMRDHLHGQREGAEEQKKQLAEIYRREFGDLRREVEKFANAGMFQELTVDNYNASTQEQRAGLRNNLRNTEVDIVLASPDHLFVGEAKHLSRFGASSRNVLTHQLIRQYVTARILLELRGDRRRVVPFIVSDGGTSVENSGQVQFMCEQGWLREENILEWSDIEALW